MPYRILKSIVFAIGIVTVVMLIAAKIGQYGGPMTLGRYTPTVAWWACAWPLIACGLFTLLQGWPGGRRIVGAPWAPGADVWPLILVLLMAIPSLEVGKLVRAGSTVGSAYYLFMTLGTIVLCTIARIIQLHLGAIVGATLEDGTAPTP